MRTRSAFTLVELSIVLVIIGLLVGGVLVGQSLIKAAELRAVSREWQQYQTAIASFKDKYFAFPGDMRNAVSFWGAQAGGTADGIDATCAALAVAATSTATCNGNGDGVITFGMEGYRFWQHLANAGLVAGKFSGIQGPNGFIHSVPGTNVPASKFGGGTGGWSVYNFGILTGDPAMYDAVYNNFFFYGKATLAGWTSDPIMLGLEAWNIDNKVDDGAPHTGKMLSWRYASMPSCVVSTDDAYDLTSSTIGCGVVFITGF
jgi:prepilin-type N-terminal cleavage/methylation domain-containing protein